MENSILQAVQQICDEKGIPIESVVETIEAALAAAYRKDYGSKNQNIKVKFNLETNEFEVYDEKTTVDKPIIEEDEESDEKENISQAVIAERTPEEIEEEKALKFNPKNEIQIADAKIIKEDAKVGDVLRIPLETHKNFGRMASQTAKQVIIQKLREAERQTLYEEFKGKEKEIINGVLQRSLGNSWLVDLGKVSGMLTKEERSPYEEYKSGMKMKFYILSVEQTSKGPEILLSRSHQEILRKLLILEIPEIAAGTVEIKSLAREAGARSKLAVKANDDSIDPIGACVGQRGARIQTIINELGNEKVDIILYNEDIRKFIANSLSPAKVESVDIREKEHFAKVIVKEDQLSLAIGKAGQNVRLAAKLTGWKINIKSIDGKEFIMEGAEEEKKESDLVNLPAKAKDNLPDNIETEKMEASEEDKEQKQDDKKIIVETKEKNIKEKAKEKKIKKKKE
ncbi:MAG: transcription termination factor NusA [bacterium]